MTSTMLLTPAPVPRTTLVPFVAVYSLVASRIPFTKTSTFATVYVTVNVVCPAVAVKDVREYVSPPPPPGMFTVTALVAAVAVTPAPVKLKLVTPEVRSVPSSDTEMLVPVPAGPVGPVGPGVVDAAPVGPVGPVPPALPLEPVGPVGPVAPTLPAASMLQEV